MLRLIKYLKPYTLLVLTAIALLFVQANADLALPDYMSRIVNVGIQQGGVEHAAPSAIRESEMNRLFFFLSAEEKAAVLADYTLVDSQSPEYADTLAKYPAAADQPVYVLQTADPAEIEKLNPVMGKALLIVSGLEQMAADPAKATALGTLSGFDLSRLPPGMDLWSALPLIPATARTAMMDTIHQKFDSLGASMVNQMALGAVRAEYAALGVDTARMQTDYILLVGGQMLLLTLLSVACTVAVGYLSARTAAGAARDLRRDVFRQVEGFSSAEFDKFSTASLITRSTNDITQIQMVVILMMRMVFYAPIIGVGGIIRALDKSTSMWWIIALAVIVLIGIITTVFSVSLPKFKVMQNLIDRLNLVTRENLSGMMVIRAFNMQGFETERFDKANRDLTATNLFVSRVMVIMMPLMMTIMNGLSLLILWVGAHQIAQSTMQVGDMMAFLQYAMQIVFSFLMVSFMFIILPRASVSAGRIADVLETPATVCDPDSPRAFPEPFQGTVEFRDVGFRYPGADENVLCGISFTASPGQTTAIIGSTGCGKSTVVNLIPRFYDATEGSVRIDGVDIREVSQHDLRERIGYIPQRGMLFSGTVESNLRFGDEDAPDAALRDAIEIAQADEFIFGRPEGLAGEISQGGINISGGQKQRLAIARALVKKPPIYIFDDSFSALDFRTDAALRKALREKTGGSTVIIVTQRIATIKNADLIVVLEEGQVVGRGTHSELMKECGTYREIALSQLSKEELA